MRRITASGATFHAPASAAELFAELRRAAAAEVPVEGLEVGVFVVRKQQIMEEGAAVAAAAAHT
jgi:transcriptional regulator GlxA family with amidase domain